MLGVLDSNTAKPIPLLSGNDAESRASGLSHHVLMLATRDKGRLSVKHTHNSLF